MNSNKCIVKAASKYVKHVLSFYTCMYIHNKELQGNIIFMCNLCTYHIDTVIVRIDGLLKCMCNDMY